MGRPWMSCLRWLIGAFPLFAAIFIASVGGAQDISTHNTARYAGDGWWDWTVYIQAPPEVLEQIKCVKYTLHPTFPDPVRTVCETKDTNYPFGYSTSGWGTFEIKVNVEYIDGEGLPLRHMLAFKAPSAREDLPIETRNVAKKVGKRLWRWTVFIRAPQDALELIQCVEYTLHPTFPDPVQEVCQMGTVEQPFALTAQGWGTFAIGVRVFLNDGSVKELAHQLRF